MKFRPHISLDVTNLDASIRFYSAVFGIEPTKRRDDYANFRSLEPPLHLALVSHPHHQRNSSPNQHFGIELFEDSQLHVWREQVVSAGHPVSKNLSPVATLWLTSFGFKTPMGMSGSSGYIKTRLIVCMGKRRCAVFQSLRFLNLPRLLAAHNRIGEQPGHLWGQPICINKASLHEFICPNVDEFVGSNLQTDFHDNF